MPKPVPATFLRTKLDETNDITRAIVDLWHRIDAGEISLPEARTKALLARELLNVQRIEIMAARVGKTSFNSVQLISPGKTITGSVVSIVRDDDKKEDDENKD